MLTIKIDRNIETPLFMQVFYQIKQLIDKNTLIPGDRLPSTRELSKFLDINRTTVYKAYEELWASGYIESKTGSYSTVRERFGLLKTSDHNTSAAINWTTKWAQKAESLNSIDNVIKESLPSDQTIDFTPLSPDPEYIPKEAYRKIVNETLRQADLSVFNYENPYGNESLRKVIATQMQLHAIKASPSEILVTNGAQNAIELLIKLFTSPGSVIIVEKPTYSAILPLFKFYELEIIEVSMTDDGIDLQQLEKEIETKSPALIYTMPNFQNPTGITTSQVHREKFLQIAEKYEIPIIEDGFIEELKYYGKNILPIKSMDKKGLVFYVGTFSKVLFPGLRIGWVVADKTCIEKLSAIKHAAEISGSTLIQAVVARFCKQGFFEKQLKKMHKIYRKRMNTALKVLRENLINPNVKYTKPIGGYTIWFELSQDSVKESELIESFKREGVKVTPGATSYSQTPANAHFRISIAHRNEQEIEVGLMKIIYILNHLN